MFYLYLNRVRNMITCKYSGNLDADRKVITHCCKLHKVDDDYDFEIVQNINEELDEQINLNKEYCMYFKQ